MAYDRPLYPGVFVTGTDTGVGKTRIAIGLMEAMKDKGLEVCGMKPVASGCYREKGELRNEDAVLLRVHASRPSEYSLVNPYAFADPVSPHIAAVKAEMEVDLEVIANCFDQLRQQSQFVVVEGIGGWEVPLNDKESVSDLAEHLALPVVLVVGLRLGCLNHAFLTLSAIQKSNCSLLGWVANRIDPDFSCVEENIESLKARIPAPLLGIIPFDSDLKTSLLAGCFDLVDWVKD